MLGEVAEQVKGQGTLVVIDCTYVKFFAIHSFPIYAQKVVKPIVIQSKIRVIDFRGFS